MKQYKERPKRCVRCGDMPGSHNLNGLPHCYACVCQAYIEGVCQSCGHVGNYLHPTTHLRWLDDRMVRR